MQPIETYEHKGVTVEIHWDDNPSEHSNPRQNDGNLTTMVCWHPDYVLGDKQFTNGDGCGAVETRVDNDNYRSMRHLARCIELIDHGICILPLYLYDHSGISISAGHTNPFDNPTVRTDESMIGFVYTTHARIDELCGTDGPAAPSYHSAEWIQQQVLAEVKEYDSYLRGEVYGYVIDPGGPDEDACWGFVGDDDYVKQEANAAAECAAHAKAERARRRGRPLHKAGITADGIA